MALSVPLSRSTLRVGGGSAFFVRHHYAMKARTFTFAVFVIGVLVTSYLGWALHRSSLNVFADHWPRAWPYPDGWLTSWEHQMDIARPAPRGFLKLDGEWQRQWIYLYCWIGLSVVLSLGSFVWWIILRKRDRDA